MGLGLGLNFEQISNTFAYSIFVVVARVQSQMLKWCLSPLMLKIFLRGDLC